MTASRVILELAGAVALLLWGLHMVHSGVMRAYGSQLRAAMARHLRHRLAATAAGLVATAALQSSTATIMMASAFAASGAVALGPALAVGLGANAGTALIVLVLSFDVAAFYPVLVLGGVFVFRRFRRTRARDLGRVAIGLGLMLLSLHLMGQTVLRAADTVSVAEILRLASGDVLLDGAVGAILAWAAHSSLATMLVVIGLAGSGVLDPASAFAMTLGANLGSAVNPLLDAWGPDRSRLAVPLGNVLNRVVGAIIVLPVLGPASAFLTDLLGGAGKAAALFHVLFNIGMALVFLPLLPWLARRLTAWLPKLADPADPSTPRYLDEAAVAMPALALANAAREALRMADVLEAMLQDSEAAFRDGDRDRAAAIGRRDDVLDALHSAIHRYLAAVSQDGLTEAEASRLAEIVGFTINIEHAGDILDKNLMELAQKRARQAIPLPREAVAEITSAHRLLTDSLHLAAAVFISADMAAAQRLVGDKESFREVEQAAQARLLARLREGDPAAVEGSGIELDAVRDLKRIGAHLAAVAYPLLEREGLLRPSRLAPAAATA